MAFRPHAVPAGAGRSASTTRLMDAMDDLAAKALPVDQKIWKTPSTKAWIMRAWPRVRIVLDTNIPARANLIICEVGIMP